MPDLGLARPQEAAETLRQAAARWEEPRRRRRGDAPHLPREPRAHPPPARRPRGRLAHRRRRHRPRLGARLAQARVAPQDALDAGAGARPRGDRAEPGPLAEGEAPARRAPGSEPADGRARRGRRPPPPRAYRLPALVLDATGMRVGELEQLTWGDVDEPRGRWRVSAASSKSGAARWMTPAGAVRGRHGARAARGPHARAARLPGVRRRQVPHGAHARLHRRRRARVLAARPPAPPCLAAPPRRDAVGAASASSSATVTS